jgi:hypothetical protein
MPLGPPGTRVDQAALPAPRHSVSGLRYRTVQSWLLGERRIPADAVAPLAAALGTSTDWLLLGRAAVFDRQILVDHLDLIEQVRQLSKHQTSFDECAELFIRLYEHEYMKRRVAGDHERRLLEGALAEIRRIRTGEI